MLVIEEKGKPEYSEKNLSVQDREPTNSTHIGSQVWEHRAECLLFSGHLLAVQ